MFTGYASNSSIVGGIAIFGKNEVEFDKLNLVTCFGNIIPPVERNGDKQIKTLLFFVIFIIGLAGRESITDALPAIGITELVIFSISTSPPVISAKAHLMIHFPDY